MALSPDVAVLTEPMAVGWHAVARGEVGKKDVAVVIGCGPVGLAVITILKSRGVRTIIASDPSPGRRALAKRCGADIVVDPTEGSPFATAEDYKHFTTVPGRLQRRDGRDRPDVEAAGRLVARLARRRQARRDQPEGAGDLRVRRRARDDRQHHGGRTAVLARSSSWALHGRRPVRPSMAINKEIDLRFVLGYTPLEFRDTLHALADGKIDASPMLTGRVGLDGVATAFAALGDPETHAKIVIDPRLTGSEVQPV